MLKTLSIRDAQPSEAKSLTSLAMRSKAYWGYSVEFMAACRKELLISPDKITSDQFYYLVAEKRNKIVGFYALENLSGFEFELEALFVEPKYIGTGVGRALMNHAKNHAAALGGYTLIIQADPNAEKFYHAVGGELVGRRESASIPGRFLPMFKILLVGQQ